VKSSAPYKKQGVDVSNFFGMISNIDDNVGALRAFLKKEGLAENTIFIFTTDNGTSSGAGVFNAGMRGRKGSEYDGGHRVPFFIHWPKGGLTGGRDVDMITSYVDIVPTLIDYCDVPAPKGVKFDGVNIRPLIEGYAKTWPDRILVTDSQRVRDPIKWRKSAVMTDQWRFINGKELYDIKTDAAQKNNVASANPGVVKRLTKFYDDWWTEIAPSFGQPTAIYLGAKAPLAHPVEPTPHPQRRKKTKLHRLLGRGRKNRRRIHRGTPPLAQRIGSPHHRWPPRRRGCPRRKSNARHPRQNFCCCESPSKTRRPETHPPH
jgi:arylsulfatase B